MTDLWERIKNEGEQAIVSDRFLHASFENAIVKFENFGAALAHRIAGKLAFDDLGSSQIETIARESFASDSTIIEGAEADIWATLERDPACHRASTPFMYYKGFWALQVHRITHYYWMEGRRDLARLLQMRNSEVFTFDAHPGARVGKGIMFDHAHSIVIGETAVIEDDVSILHSVTLGGTGKIGGDRHPKVRSGVMIGAGAKILGNIEVGKCSRVAAGSVVLEDVKENTTVAGVPAKVIGMSDCPEPANSMEQNFFVTQATK